MNSKKCTKCNIIKPFDEFHKRKDSKDGLKSWCKHCRKTIEWPVQEKKYRARRKKVNDIWNPEHKEYKHQWYLDHKEEQNERGREWYLKNKDKAHDAYKKRYEADPQAYIQRALKRRARIAGCEINDFTTKDWYELLEEYGHRCAYCGGGGKMVKEHKVPIVRGGNHTKSNIVPACKSCNNTKYTKTDEEFLNTVETGPGS
jgi:5-methylcytosine-specific restriction endonuclease McrA